MQYLFKNSCVYKVKFRCRANSNGGCSCVMVIKKNNSKYRLMRLKKLAARDGYEIINGEMHSFCYICKDRKKLEDFTIDHYQARYHNGTNRLENLKICCFPCNLRKAKNERPALPHSRIYYILIRPILKFFRRILWEIKNRRDNAG